MKKQLLIFSLLFSNVCAFAQMSEIQGVVKSNSKSNDISLLKVQDGEFQVLATTQLNDDGSFTFLFKPSYEGFYAIGSKDLNKPQFPVYLKQGDNAAVTIDHNNHVELAGKNTPENTVLASWSKLTEELKSKYRNSDGSASSLKDFSNDLAQVAGQAGVFKKTINTKNAKFNVLMQELTSFDLDFYALSCLYSQREKAKSDDLSAYYKNLVVKDKFSNDDIFLTGKGKKLMHIYPMFASGYNKTTTLDEKLQCLTTDRQRGELVLTEYGDIKTYGQFDEMMTKYGKYMQSASQKKIIEEFDKKLFTTKTSVKEIDFTYPDKDGKMVSLSDFLGKVVVVDVWATWCGPCKSEIPHLKTLEKELHGNDIVFMSISTDKMEDKDKWLKMVNEMEMTGVQLLAGKESKISQDYQISTIPRFMVFDKKGNIVNMNAPRPSEPELKQILLSELKK